MFPYHQPGDIYSGASAMTNYPGNWSCEQSQQNISNRQNFPNLGSAAIVNNHSNHMTWSSPLQATQELKQKPTFDSANFHNASFPQRTPVQYTPLTPEPVPYPVFNLPRPQLNHNMTMAKRHRAAITLVPTKTGEFKAIVKRKRKRTAFTTEQVAYLEEIFKRKQYVTREDREVLVNQLQLNDKAVKIWFQNRRLKDKKGQAQYEEDQEIVQTTEGIARAKLDNVESKINEKTDEFGYVTLDDGLMKDLFNVIDDVLTKNAPVQTVAENHICPVYEPISPASGSDSNDTMTASQWQPSEPNESLQRLFDLQALFSL